ncbi:MAG TPA: RNA polymerase sigma factor [Chloroflexia bacterium]|jgi:RNA polymerase sigma-70 factor (ECF subfamily)|nr:RNA polymerase sigma factor [Chloroflexia bacterium]
MNEDDLIRRARSGDTAAFRELVLAYTKVSALTARVLLENPGDAEDAVQEAWLDVWRGLPTFGAGRPFRPWLLAVVKNRCRMLARGLKAPSVPYDEASYDASEPVPSPEAAMFGPGGEAFEDLQAALDGLDAENARILALRFYADLQLHEISEVLDMPLNTVKTRLRRTLHFLRVSLEREQRIENGKR